MDFESEQRFHDLEQRHISLKREHEIVTIDKEALKAKVASLQALLDQNALQLAQQDRKAADSTLEIAQRDKLVQDLTLANAELNDRCRRRSDECDRLRDDLKAQAAEMVTLQGRLKDSQFNLNEFQTSTLPTQYELTKTIHEKNLLADQVKYLEAELQKKSTEDRALRAESARKADEMAMALAEANAQLDAANKQLATVKDQSANQGEKVDHYMAKLREAEYALAEKQGAFTSEVEGLKRLVDLYKRYFEEATAKVTSLEQHEEVVRETNTNVLKALRDKCAQQIAEAESAAEKDRAELTARVKDLEAQLQAAQSARSLVPLVEGTASAASSALAIENFDGIGITEMYDRVVHTERELFAERSKRREVELYMQQILKDVESKAPIIASQRRDYHRVVESHTALSRRMDGLVVENVELKQTVKALTQRTQQAEEEAHVLEEHNADLGRQVQHLLKRSMGLEFGGFSQSARVEMDTESQTPGGVISQYLVTFEDIGELQQKNAELLRVVRKLSREQEQAQSQLMLTDVESSSSSGASTQAALQAAMEELSNMREARKRTEEMVVVLAQQRDMYRSMAEGDNTVMRVTSPGAKSPGAGLFGQSPSTARGSSSSDAASAQQSAEQQGNALWNSAAVRELQSKLSQAEDNCRRLQERITRFEEVEQLLNESLDKVRKEATTARMEAAQGTSEARFQKERAERLETTLLSTQQESANALQRRLEMERTLLDAHKEVRTREERISELHDQLRASQESQRRAEIEAEVAKTSEGRLVTQLSEAREETKRHVSLVEHINRIESGLQGRAEAEKEALAAENQSLKASYETVRKQLDDRTLLDEQRAKVSEEELRSIRTRLEQKTAELAGLSEELTRAQLTAQAAQDRSNLLERQLTLAQERLTQTQGSQIIETSMASDYTSKELALERAQTEIEALRQQLASTEVHAEQFRKISAVNESALKELRAKAAAAEAEQAAEVANMRAELEAAQKDLQDNRANSQGLLQEAEDAREQLRTASAEAAEKVRKLEESLALVQQECDQLKVQGATVTGEIARFQEAARLAHQNYERELQLHATAERELSELRRVVEETKTALHHEQQRAAQLSAECIRKEAQVADERARYQQESKDSKEHIAGLQYTNDLLHAQVQSYGLQIERLHEQRLLQTGITSALPTAAVAAAPAAVVASAAVSTPSVAAAADEGTGAEESKGMDTDTVTAGDEDSQATQTLATTQPLLTHETTQPLPSQTQSEEAAAAGTEAPAYDELSELRKSTTEMREVLRYMKREKDMLQAKLSVAETENSRLGSELQSLRRSLDEVRAELKRELDKRTPLRSADEFNRLMGEVNQLNIVRESNLHLRGENEELSKRVTSLTASLNEAKDAATPLEETIRKLRAEKESLDMTNDQLNNDVQYWRNRLQILISRYNDVDPEEHRLLKTKLEEVTSTLADVQKALAEQQAAAEQANAAAATAAATAAAAASEGTAAKDKEIESLKSQVTGAEASATRLRDTMRALKERWEAAVARAKDADAKLAAEKQNTVTLEAQIAEAKVQVEKLTAEKAQAEAAVAAGKAAAPAPAAGAAVAGGAPALPARRKRPAPGAAPTTPGAEAAVAPGAPAAVAAQAVAPSVAVAAEPVAPHDGPVLMTVAESEGAPSAQAAPVPAAAVTATHVAAAPTPAVAAGETAETGMSRMKQALLRKKNNLAAAAGAPSAAEGGTVAAGAPAAAAAPLAAETAPTQVTGKRAAPSDGDASAASGTALASGVPVNKKRRPPPPTTAPPAASVAAAAAPVAQEETPAATETTPAPPAVTKVPSVVVPVSTGESGDMDTSVEPAAVKDTTAAPADEAPQPAAAASPVPEVVPARPNPFAAFAAGGTSSMFPAPAAAPTGGLFSASAQSGPFSSFGSAAPATGGLFGFGSTATPSPSTAAPAKNPWSTASTTTSTFGSTPATGGLFGQAVAPAAVVTSTVPIAVKSIFGNAAQSGTSTLFGKASAPTVTGPFSAPSVPEPAPVNILPTIPEVAVAAPVPTPTPAPAPAAAAAAVPASVAVLAGHPTSGPEYQKRIEARAARFAAGAQAAAAKTAPVATPVAAPVPTPAPIVQAPAPVQAEVAPTAPSDEAQADAEVEYGGAAEAGDMEEGEEPEPEHGAYSAEEYGEEQGESAEGEAGNNDDLEDGEL